jgi:hypothetical protein
MVYSVSSSPSRWKNLTQSHNTNLRGNNTRYCCFHFCFHFFSSTVTVHRCVSVHSDSWNDCYDRSYRNDSTSWKSSEPFCTLYQCLWRCWWSSSSPALLRLRRLWPKTEMILKKTVWLRDTVKRWPRVRSTWLRLSSSKSQLNLQQPKRGTYDAGLELLHFDCHYRELYAYCHR